MPELPDIELYLSALRRFIGGRTVESIVVKSPFVVRSIYPPIEDCVGRTVSGFRRLGKRIVWELGDELFLVFHLMIAGRFHWKGKPMMPRGKNDLVAFRFNQETLMLTEASTKKRASIHVVAGELNLQPHHPAGIEVLGCSAADFRQQLTCENHTLKRALTDPRLFSGIGNAYSDEILHAAKLSPVRLTSKLTDAEISRLYQTTINVLTAWVDRLAQANGDAFPERVTAFRPEMAAHGKFRQPCPECGTPIQRIVYAENETNYCPRCQTDGKLLADRSLSRLLKNDWPKNIEQWEQAQ